MKIDRYTKTVLTIIALCLVWLCVRENVMPPVMAQGKAGPASVIISGIQMGDGLIPISIRDISVKNPYNRFSADRTTALPIFGKVETTR